MYYPYFRGKQFELQAIKESSETLAEANFTPVIEPVRSTTTGLNALKRSLEEIIKNDGTAFLVINPKYGELKNNSDTILNLLEKEISNPSRILPAILLHQNLEQPELQHMLAKMPNKLTLIHDGYLEARDALEDKNDRFEEVLHIFVGDPAKEMLYRKHFDGEKVLVYDGFNRTKNANYPERENFSEIHITYQDLGADGYGDFLIVGDQYSETGGPAFAVAIHLTFIDAEQDNVMAIRHFISNENNSPADPAKKFREALDKLVKAVEDTNTPFLTTSAVKEYLQLHKKGHFPGLGYVKKLSMIHHIETLANFEKNKRSHN
ncbi:sce7725 family protein [Corynebacterium durum]|uniref:sce7725 family protein n=1 Tax=Corynebacterium durum TaxID=61592 RepID=UPI0028E4D9E7|nr:sce7725 family protein [Corynebacterium durum]